MHFSQPHIWYMPYQSHYLYLATLITHSDHEVTHYVSYPPLPPKYSEFLILKYARPCVFPQSET